MSGMTTYAYACPPMEPGRGGPWPDTGDDFVIPSNEPMTITLNLDVIPIPGLAKLRERLKTALREGNAMLDMDEVAAMVWLEALR